MTMDSNREPEAVSSQELLIASYVLGDMAAGEKAAFERRVDRDPALAREVEAWREANEAASDWMESAPPGIERVNELAVPTLKVGSVRLRSRFTMSRRQVVQRAFLVAAIFLIGFWSGRLGSLGQTQSDYSIPDGAVESVVPVFSGLDEDETKRQPAAEDETDPSVIRQASKEPTASEGASTAASPVLVRSTTDENGRLIIDTENRASGLRVRWFVEPSFEIAQTSNQY